MYIASGLVEKTTSNRPSAGTAFPPGAEPFEGGFEADVPSARFKACAGVFCFGRRVAVLLDMGV
jgi:hypothetical protein